MLYSKNEVINSGIAMKQNDKIFFLRTLKSDLMEQQSKAWLSTDQRKFYRQSIAALQFAIEALEVQICA